MRTNNDDKEKKKKEKYFPISKILIDFVDN